MLGSGWVLKVIDSPPAAAIEQRGHVLWVQPLGNPSIWIVTFCSCAAGIWNSKDDCCQQNPQGKHIYYWSSSMCLPHRSMKLISNAIAVGDSSLVLKTRSSAYQPVRKGTHSRYSKLNKPSSLASRPAPTPCCSTASFNQRNKSVPRALFHTPACLSLRLGHPFWIFPP